MTAETPSDPRARPHRVGIWTTAGSLAAAVFASAFHPYLTLSEAVKLAAIGFKKDVQDLSCCAS